MWQSKNCGLIVFSVDFSGRQERMNEVLNSLNTIVQKQSDIKASIAAARSEDNIQQVYDLKVQLEKLTTQQLLLMTEQTDLIKRQRRSDRYATLDPSNPS